MLRNEEGDVVYACGKEINEGTNTEAEATAILEAFTYCLDHHYYLIILHTYSMLLKNVLDGIWIVPWNVAVFVEEIKVLMTRCNISVAHTLREGIKLADHLANYTLDVGSIKCDGFEQLDIQSRRIVNNDKSQCPYLRVKVGRS